MKNIAIYLRLSLADADLGENGKDESNSIENQRLLIRNYLTVHPEILGDVVEYKDDGYTGLNFNRPAFRQMIEDAKRGSVGTIIVKDLSRLGRDYIGMGDYLERIFPALGVRLIAINSRYDSAEQGANVFSFDVSISNMINNMYSRDISKKVRSAFVAKWKKGMNPSTSVPYGYTTDRNDPTHTPVVDPEAADVVKRIFSMAVAGCNSKMIAEHLNMNEMLTPAMYKHVKYGRKVIKNISEPEERLWNTHMVVAILRRYDYTGARVHGKNECIGIGSGKTRRKSKQEWYVVENNHEALVSKEEYDLAQQVIQSNGPRRKCRNKNMDILVGRVRCSCCGNVLQFHGEKELYCQHSMDVGNKSKCNKDYYDAAKIRGAIKSSLKKQMDLMAETSSALKRMRQKAAPAEKENAKTLDDHIKELNDELVRQYENYVNGNLQRERFKAKKEEIVAERSRIQNRLSELEMQTDESDKLLFETERIVSIGSKARNYIISREVLDALVDDICINPKGELEIKYKFENILESAVRELQDIS